MRLPALPLRHPHDAEILRLAIPSFGALVAEPLFLLADSAIVGHLGTPQLAGLGVAGTIIQTAVSLCIFLAYGTTSAVARMLGADDVAGALRRGIDGLWLALLIGIGLAAGGFVGAPTMVGWFDAQAGVSDYAVTYMRVSVFGLPGMLLVLAMTGVLRGLQDARTPLYVAGAANIANVFLSLLLVYGLDMGIAGSALGTVIAQWSAALVYVLIVTRAARRLLVSLRPVWSGIVSNFSASAPLLLRNVALRGVLAIAAGVAARLGSDELAAHQVAYTIWSALALSLDAVAIAGQAIVGRYLGANDVAGARQATRRMIEWSIASGFLLGAALILGRSALAPLFSPDQSVQELIVSALLIVAIAQPLAGWVFALDGVLIGAGDTRYIGAVQPITAAVFLPLAAAVLHYNLGLTGLWWALTGWMAARLVVMVIRVRSDAWAITGASR